MLKFINGGLGVGAHVFDGVLIAQPVRPLDRVVHVPAPIVLFHVAKRRRDASLGSHSVAAGGKHLGDASRLEARRPHAERRPKTGSTGADDDRVIGFITGTGRKDALFVESAKGGRKFTLYADPKKITTRGGKGHQIVKRSTLKLTPQPVVVPVLANADGGEGLH